MSACVSPVSTENSVAEATDIIGATANEQWTSQNRTRYRHYIRSNHVRTTKACRFLLVSAMENLQPRRAFASETLPGIASSAY
jgi:hypothetical protein